MNFLNNIPSWLVSLVLAIITTGISLYVTVKILDAKIEMINQRVEVIEKNKLDITVYNQTSDRLDRIESKLDRLIERKMK